MPEELFKRIDAEVKGWVTDENGRWLASLAETVPADRAIIQIGIYCGRSCFYMAAASEAIVYGVDPWDLPGTRTTWRGGKPLTDSWIRVEAYENRRNLGLEDRVVFITDFSVVTASAWRYPVGLLMIDGDHSHEASLADALSWEPHLAPGAVVAIDDVAKNFSGVLETVRVLEKRWGPASRFNRYAWWKL